MKSSHCEGAKPSKQTHDYGINKNMRLLHFVRNDWKKTIIVVLLLGFHFFSGVSVINRLSPTYDEPLHLAAGYSYLRTDIYYLNIYDHPPLAEKFAALPLLRIKPVLPLHLSSWDNYEQYSFADSFLYKNTVDAEKMLNSGRIMILLLSCLLGYFVFRWCHNLFGAPTSFFVLALYVLFPGFAAHGTLVTTDMALTLFFFAAFYFLYEWFEKGGWVMAALCGISTGLAVCSKFSALIIFPTIVTVFIVKWLASRKKSLRAAGEAIPSPLVFFIVFLSACFIAVIFIYGFSQIGLYAEGVKTMLRSIGRGRSSFLFGNYSTTGWRHYFALVFLIKTPIPFLILLAASIALIMRLPVNRGQKLALIIPPLVYFAASSFSKIQIGFRHILPVYPFLFVIAGAAAHFAWKKIYGKVILALLLLWSAFAFARIHPWHISYFNEFTGGSLNGYKYLTDSNIDWGQGLKELSSRGYKSLYMCYFGTGDPHYYGIKYVPLGFVNNQKPEERAGDKIILKPGEKVYFAVSVTNLMATYYADKKIFAFLDGLEPVKVAYSIYVYDLTDKPDAILKLAGIYRLTGDVQAAESLIQAFRSPATAGQASLRGK